jgi:toxin ParE1/3/4
MAKFKLTPAAERDLEGIWLYTTKEWGLAQADKYIDGLVAAFTALANSPELGHRCDYVRAGYLRSHVERHLIYFKQAADEIVVIRVLHDRMDVARHL